MLKYQKWILYAEYIEQVVQYARTAQLMAENRWSQFWRGFRDTCFHCHRMWFLEKLMKIALTHRYDELFRATGLKIVCIDLVEVFQFEVMAGGRCSGDRGKVFQKNTVFLWTLQKTWSIAIFVQASLDSLNPSCVVPHVWTIHSSQDCDHAFLEILTQFTLYHRELVQKYNS